MLSPCQRYAVIGGTVLLGVYVLFMDFRMYQALQQWMGPTVNASRSHHSSTQTVTMKWLLMPHSSNYIYHPLAEYFDEKSKFSKRFPFITANMVSFAHVVLFASLLPLIYSGSLAVRRWGSLGLFMANWLDVYDGVVHRSHVDEEKELYYTKPVLDFDVDNLVDICVAILQCVALYLCLLKNPPTRGHSRTHVLPVSRDQQKTLINWELGKPCIAFGGLVGLSGLLLGRYVARFGYIFEYIPKTSIQQKQQLLVMKSTQMWVIIWLRRFVSSFNLIDYAIISIALDKVWAFLQLMLYVGWPLVILLWILTEIQLCQAEKAILGS
ncbi:ceramide phosphoethanolamine synthase-like [Liolophura sinensis]|uniref:ceramide phosphoethanolamine synthase-like n=1 Tax=Liolophura sinensis TaxID=3198878 RepID=UPI0031594950